MNQPDTHTETVTRTETVTETVTTAACPVCEQRVDSAELVSVEIGGADDATGCCRYCAQALFGYQGEPDGAASTPDTSDPYMPHEVVAARVGTLLGRLSAHRQELVSLTVGLIMSVVTIVVGVDVANEAAAQMSRQSVTQFGAAAELFPAVFTTLLIAVVLWMIAKMMVVGPRP